MKNELLLLGGSHMAQIIKYTKERSNRAIGLPENFEIRGVSCSDLDMSATFAVTPDRGLDCRGHALLARSCEAAYGGQIIPYSPDRIICLLVNSWHHVDDDPIWASRYPAEIQPGLGQSVPISTNEVIERLWQDVYIRVRVADYLRNSGQRFFALFAPFVPFALGATVGVPPRTGQYLHGLCHMLYKNALNSLGVKYVENSPSFISPEGFLKPELSNFNNSHGNDKYMAMYWEEIRSFLDQHNWRPELFDYDALPVDNDFFETARSLSPELLLKASNK